MAYQSLLYGGLGDLEAKLSYACNSDVNLKCSSPCGTQQNEIVLISYRRISFAYMYKDFYIYISRILNPVKLKICSIRNVILNYALIETTFLYLTRNQSFPLICSFKAYGNLHVNYMLNRILSPVKQRNTTLLIMNFI